MAWRVVGWRRSGRLIDEGSAAPIHGLEAGTRGSARRSGYSLSDGTVYRTYVMSAPGLEAAMAYYGLLDRTPKGRAEDDSSPLWVRRHDEYEAT